MTPALPRQSAGDITDEMVARAAYAIHAAYMPDEGDDPEEAFRAAVRKGLEAALTTNDRFHPPGPNGEIYAR